MSAKGQEQTCLAEGGMSALPLKADIRGRVLIPIRSSFAAPSAAERRFGEVPEIVRAFGASS